MKKFLLILALYFPLLAFSQSNRYYIYNIVSFEGNIKKEGLKVRVDNGDTIEKLKGEDGKDIKFHTPVAALMYFISQGWELYINGTTSEGSVINGIGGSSTTSDWIIRKPCTHEEFDKAVKEGIKKNHEPRCFNRSRLHIPCRYIPPLGTIKHNGEPRRGDIIQHRVPTLCYHPGGENGIGNPEAGRRGGHKADEG